LDALATDFDASIRDLAAAAGVGAPKRRARRRAAVRT
jgi:hypothetical protein